MGAAGRDFHNFNVYFRDNKEFEVIAFTATQIPNIEGRRYPSELAGSQYPSGIPIYPETDLVKLILENEIDQVIFAYSDVPYRYVMSKASLVLAAGADFRIMGLENTLVKSTKPVVSVWKKPNYPPCIENSDRDGLQRCCHPSPYAIW